MMFDNESEIRELKNVIEELQAEIEVLNKELDEQREISLSLKSKLLMAAQNTVSRKRTWTRVGET